MQWWFRWTVFPHPPYFRIIPCPKDKAAEFRPIRVSYFTFRRKPQNSLVNSYRMHFSTEFTSSLLCRTWNDSIAMKHICPIRMSVYNHIIRILSHISPLCLLHSPYFSSLTQQWECTFHGRVIKSVSIIQLVGHVPSLKFQKVCFKIILFIVQLYSQCNMDY